MSHQETEERFDDLSGNQPAAQEPVTSRYGGTQSVTTTVLGETTAAAVSSGASMMEARERARVLAMAALATQHPRDYDQMEQRLMADCNIFEFADKSRWTQTRRAYNRDTGRWEETFITGWTIRFAEAALAHMTNVEVDALVQSEDDEYRHLRVVVTDWERRVSYTRPLVIPKTIERRKLRKGQSALRQRTNSSGDVIFIVAATEAELLQSQQAAVSRALRTEALRLVPSDILAKCQDRVQETLEAGAASEERVNSMADYFDSLGVSREMLCAYLECDDLISVVPRQLVRMRGIAQAIYDGTTTWLDVAGVQSSDQTAKDDTAKAADKPKSRTDEALEKDSGGAAPDGG